MKPPEGMHPAKFERQINVTSDFIQDNIRSALDRGLKSYWYRPCVIVGGGPSLAKYEDELKDELGWTDAPERLRPKLKKTVYSLNNTHDWLIERRIIPDFHVMMDARQENAEFVRNWHPKVTYLIASQCHPDVFDALEGANVKVWHAHGAKAHEVVQEPMIMGSGTVISRAVHIAHDSGMRQFSLYGVDSSYEGEKHHAYKQELNNNENILEFWMGGKEYQTTGAFAAQAEDFLAQAKTLESMGSSFEFHCDGLLPDMWRVDKAQRASMTLEQREREKYRKMWAVEGYSNYSPGEWCLPNAIKEMEVPKGASVIDFGCGTGRATKRMADAGYIVTGVDFAPEALDDDVVGKIKFLESNLWELPEDLEGDYAFCCDVMEHIPPSKVQDVLKGIHSAIH